MGARVRSHGARLHVWRAGINIKLANCVTARESCSSTIASEGLNVGQAVERQSVRRSCSEAQLAHCSQTIRAVPR